ncbi:MAG: type IV pilin [Haloarculaceae archaeon]
MRAVSSVVGTVVLLGVVVVGATAVFAAVPADEPATVPTARLSLTAEAGPDRVALTHEGGDTLSAASLDVTVRVDGDPVTHQPPVPFFAATGFESGPTGPFNSAHRGQWRAGETAALRLASTNTQLDPGDSVSVTVRTDAGVVARLETTA